ncbi:MAG: hypothetical protein WC951_13695 [Bacteroidales bacterium]
MPAFQNTKIFCLRLLAAVFILSLFHSELSAQAAKVSVIKGRNVAFNFNNFNDFANGKDLPNWTTLILQVDSPNNWEFSIRSEYDRLDSMDDFIPIDSLTISIVLVNQTAFPVDALLKENSMQPNTSPTVVIEGGTLTNTVELLISYRLAPMVNKKPGVYYVQLDYNLVVFE